MAQNGSQNEPVTHGQIPWLTKQSLRTQPLPNKRYTL